ncbi:hypothetical protein GIB67_032872 [Kingdonia uniflora]|uniref:Uncharacterized protein n=1 Tax=Kingdonia uniflora TaxID=39325 RepID=A0A7J7NC68_9MAGN|nr:hypothetical protein GIB67_032872 [Kingdonia uniflora]
MYFVNFLIVLIVYVALVLGKSISPLEDHASYLILPLEDCASYLDDKCLIGFQKEDSVEMIKRMRPQDSVQNVVYLSFWFPLDVIKRRPQVHWVCSKKSIHCFKP